MGAQAQGSDVVLPPPDVTTWHFRRGRLHAHHPQPLARDPASAPARVDVVRNSTDDGDETETNFGLSGGAVSTSPMVLSGLHGRTTRTADRRHPGVFGVGAHHAFRTPGL